MAAKSVSDLALTALAVEAERRRKARGLLRYHYGDLVAETTFEERQRIIEEYKMGSHGHIRNGTERFEETDDQKDLQNICKKHGVQEVRILTRPSKKKI